MEDLQTRCPEEFRSWARPWPGAHYLIFHDEHHLFIFVVGDIAFIPIEVLIVTLIIDQMLESREKLRRMEKLNMVIGTFFSTLGTPLIARLTGADDTIGPVKERLVVTANWNAAMFLEMRKCLDEYTCSVSIIRINLEDLRVFLIDHEDFLLGIVENPMVFEHESFTDLILALNHLTEEMKSRGDLSALPPADKSHFTTDIKRVYSPAYYRMDQIYGISQTPLLLSLQPCNAEEPV